MPFLNESKSSHWCPHATALLSSALTDGTVPKETGLKIMESSEAIAKERGHYGVLSMDMFVAWGREAKHLDYEPMQGTVDRMPDHPMEHRKVLWEEEHKVHKSCFDCQVTFAKECETEWGKELEEVSWVGKQLKERGKMWCYHVHHSLGRALRAERFTKDKFFKVLDLAEKVAEERGHPGVAPRDFYIALGRAYRLG